MKKRILSIILVLCMVCTLLPAAALADELAAPELSGNTVYGNGYPLLIEAGETSGTTVKYDSDKNYPYDFETELTANNANLLVIYGGSKETAVGSSNIKMTGGSVDTIYGGGYAENAGSSVGSAIITIIGGTVGTIYAGGYGRYGETATVDNSSVGIHGGSIGTVYGGGYSRNVSGYAGYSTVSVSSISVTSGTVDKLYASAAYAGKWCENYVSNSIIAIRGGTINSVVENAGKANIADTINNVTITSFVITGGSIASLDLSVTPTNGGLAVYKNEITLMDEDEANVLPNEALSALRIDGGYDYGMYDVNTDASGKIYVWLPEGLAVSGVEAASGKIFIPGSTAGVLKEHIHSWICEGATEPSCTEQGFTSYTCDCGDSYTDSYVPALGHNYVDGVCTNCGEYETIASGTCGENLTWSLDSAGNLIISGTGTMYWESVPWGEYCESIKNVVINYGVEDIGGFAFSECSSLTNIDIPESVTSIGESAFYYCISLTSIDIPGSVTSIGNGVFDCCHSLKNINVDSENQTYASVGGVLFNKNINTLIKCPGGKSGSYEIPDSVTSIGEWAFDGCSSLTSIDVPDSVTCIGERAFSSCSNLKSVNIPDGVTSIDANVFSWCSNLMSINLPDGVTSIGKCAFDGCSSLTSINIPDSVTSIGQNAFYDCSSLTSIEIPDSVTSIDAYAFECCYSLKSVTMGSSVTSIGEWAFLDCSNLKDVAFAGTEAEWADLAYEFEDDVRVHYNCDSLDGHYTSATTEATCTTQGFTTYTCDCGYSYVDDYVDALGHDEVYHDAKAATCTEAGWEAYYTCSRCDYSTYEEIPALGHDYVDGVCTNCGEYETIASGTCGENLTWSLDSAGNLIISGTGTMYWESVPWGEYCESIKNVVIKDGAEDIAAYAFSCCSNLTNISIPDSVTSIGAEAFNGCSSLTSVSISENVTSIGSGVFVGTNSLNSIDVSSENPTYISVDGVLFNKNISTLIQCPGGKSGSYEIPDSVTSICDYAFSGCHSLTSIDIPYGVTRIGFGAFSYCSNLRSINIPFSVTNMSVFAFCGCSNLTSVIIPSGIANIGDFTFRDCSSLTNICIPDSITNIGYAAFSGCSSLQSVYYGGTKVQWEDVEIDSVNEDLLNADICYGIEITAQPADLEASVSDKIEFSVEARGADLSYQWQYSKNGGETWVNSTVSSATTDDFSCKNSKNYDGRIYRCVITDVYGNTVTTDAAQLTVITSEDKNTCGENLTWTLDSEGTLTISGTGSMSWEGLAPWADYRESIKNVVIKDGVEDIAAYAFECCSNLTSVSISDSVTCINDGVFVYCSSLTSVSIPSSVTSIGYCIISGCSNFISIDVDSENQTYASIDGVLFNKNLSTLILYPCGKNGSYEIPDSVTCIGKRAFSLCTGLTSVNLPDGVTSIEELAFGWCSNLTSINLPDGVTSIGKCAFYGCSSLTSICIPNSVTSISRQVFQDCSNLANIEISDSVTSIEYAAFECCSCLTSVCLPNSVTSIDDSAFWNCSNLTSISIPSSVTRIGYGTFFNCSSLQNVYYGGAKAQWSNIEINSGNEDLLNADICYGIEITAQPADLGASVSDKIEFSVEARGADLSYQWQYSKNGGETWVNSTVSLAKTADFSCKNSESYDGRLYRCVITDVYGNIVTTDAAKLTVSTPLAISAQPLSARFKAGTTYSFTVKASGDDLSYLWQYSKDGGKTWIDSTIASGKTATISGKAVAAFDGRLYRCVVSDSHGATVTSDTAMLSVYTLPTITSQPVSATFKAGTTYSFTVKASGDDLSYRWQYSKDGGKTWIDSTTASGNTATISGKTSSSFDGRLYRCVVTDYSLGYSVTSDEVKLSVGTPLNINTQPVSSSYKAGASYSFTVEASGDDLSYQWQYSKDGGKTWTNSTTASGKTAAISGKTSSSFDGRLYRCVITDSHGNTVTSSAVKLTVK